VTMTTTAKIQRNLARRIVDSQVWKSQLAGLTIARNGGADLPFSARADDSEVKLCRQPRGGLGPSDGFGRLSQSEIGSVFTILGIPRRCFLDFARICNDGDRRPRAIDG